MEKNINNKLRSLIEKINLDIQLVIGFISWIVIWTTCLKVIIFYIPQISIFPVQHGILPTLYQTVGTILISLFIFIAAEGMRDRNEKYKLQILLKESKLPTVIILFLLSIILLPFVQYRNISTIALGSLIGFIFLGIRAVYRIISIISNAKELWKFHIDVFMNRIKQVTKFAINIRLENQKLSNILNKYKNNYIRIWFFKKNVKRTYLKSKQEGTITFMSLDKLKIIFQALIDHRSINERKVSKEPNTVQPSPQSTQDNSSNYETNELQYINLYIKAGDPIKKGDPLLSFSEQLQINEILKEKLQDQLNNLIQVERLTVVDVVRDEIEGHRDKVKQLIKEKNIFQLEKYFNLYFDLVKEFLHQISQPQYGQYSYEESKKEMNSIPTKEHEGWPPLIWLKDHIMDFFENSIELNSNKIYKDVQWFSYHLIDLAQEKNDHLIFREALFLWLRQLYYLSECNFKDKEEQMKNHVNFFKEYAISLIFSNIRESNNALSKKGSYAIHLLEIIKNMFECLLKRELHFLLNNFLEIIIKIVNDDDGLAGQSINVMKIFTQDNSIFEDQSSYRSRKLQFLFGFGVCLEQLKSKKSSISTLTEFKELQKSVEDPLPILLKEYLKIYPLISNKNVNQFWHWSFFNMPLNMEVRVSNWEKYRNMYFFKLLSKIPEYEFESLDINQLDPIILSSLESLGSLTLNGNSQIITPTIKEFFKKITKYQHQQRVKYIGQMELNKNKVQHFINVFSDEFKKTANFRKIFKTKICEYKKGQQSPVFSINYIDSKEYFISDNRELNLWRQNNLNSIPLSCSQGFTRAEDKFLINEIIENCKKNKTNLNYKEFKKSLINSEEWGDHSMLIINHRKFYNKLYKDQNLKLEINYSNAFLKQHSLKLKNKNIYCILTNQSQIDSAIAIFNVEKLPALEMFDPSPEENGELFAFQFLKDIGISIGIGDFAHNNKLMNSTLNTPPDWLTKMGDKEKQKEYLVQHVNLKIFQVVNLNWNNIKTPIGTYFNISDL